MRNPLRAMTIGHHRAKANAAAEEMWRHVGHINEGRPIAAIIVDAKGAWGTPLNMPEDAESRRALEEGLASVRAAGQEA